MMSRLRHTGTLAALAVLLIGCGDDSSSTSGDTPALRTGSTTTAVESGTIAVHMVDYGFDMPEVLSGRLLDIDVINDGTVAHELALVRVEPGTTGEQVVEGFRNHDDEASFTLGDPGGINLLGAGESLRYQRSLDPGAYVAFCPLSLADGTTHMDQGMYRRFMVTDGSIGAGLPVADSTITLSDEAIGVTDLRVGTRSYAITNTGSALHELYILGVPTATDPAVNIDEEIGAWIEGGQQGGALLNSHLPGGHQTIAPGETVVLTMTFRSGYSYQFEDFVGDQPLFATATAA